MAVTRAQALEADRFHYGECTRTVGPRGGVTTTIVEYRRNGATKTWKTRPAEFQVPIKWGLRGYAYLHHLNAHEFHLTTDCPLSKA